MCMCYGFCSFGRWMGHMFEGGIRGYLVVAVGFNEFACLMVLLVINEVLGQFSVWRCIVWLY